MRKKMFGFFMAIAVLMTTIPVWAAEDNEVEFSAVSEENVVVEEATNSEPTIKETSGEDIVATESCSFVARYESAETDTSITETDFAVDVAKEAEPAAINVEEDSVADQALSASSTVYYPQYTYLCNDGYDIIAAYVQAEVVSGNSTSGDSAVSENTTKYISRMFFVYDKMYGEWLRYDYSEMAAKTFLSQYEQKDSNGNMLYVPVTKKSSDGKEIRHVNISGTALDESLIPVVALADATGINYAWKELDQIPFMKNNGAYVYAHEQKKTTPDPDPDPDPEPTPPAEDAEAKMSINGSEYTVQWTSSVQYDGRAHVWTETPIASKNAKKQVGDVKVIVYRNGAQVDPANISVSFKNNTNVTNFGGKQVQPYFVVKLLGKNYKSDAKVMSSWKFDFDITPYPVEKGKFKAKKVVVSGSKMSFSKLYFIFPDGRAVALKPLTKKNSNGTYRVGSDEEGFYFVGYNNLSGKGRLNLNSPKKITYEW